MTGTCQKDTEQLEGAHSLSIKIIIVIITNYNPLNNTGNQESMVTITLCRRQQKRH